MSGTVKRSGNEQTHTARGAAGSPAAMRYRAKARGSGRGVGRERHFDEERRRANTHYSAQRVRLTSCNAVPSGGEGKRRKCGASVAPTRNGDEQIYTATCGVAYSHAATRRRVRRGEAAEGRGVSGTLIMERRRAHTMQREV